jgi:hypothetical protein
MITLRAGEAKPQQHLGPKQLEWLRKNLIHNGVPIFALYEKQRSTRITSGMRVTGAGLDGYRITHVETR